MNITQHPELLQRLAASYALAHCAGAPAGVLKHWPANMPPCAPLHWCGKRIGRVWLNCSPAPRLTPPCGCAFQNLVQADQAQHRMELARAQAASASGWRRSLRWWRVRRQRCAGHRGRRAGGWQAHGGYRAATSAQIAALQQQLQATPQIQYVAVLADDQAAASMLVTFDPKNQKLVLQRVGGFQEGMTNPLQLWALPPAGGPRSLGFWGRTSCSPSRQPNKR